MPEIKPDRSDRNRCVSVHWNLPVQCVLPGTHRQNDHEAWHPQTGNRLRYRRSMGTYSTEELHSGEWHDLHIPPPGGYCNDQYSGYYSGQSVVRCTGQYGHGWNHRAVVDGCTHSWNTPIPKALNSDQLNSDVTQLRGLVVQLTADNAELAAKLAVAERQLKRLDGELVRLRNELERAKRPSYSTQHVWTVWREERPIHALYATEDDAKQGSIDCWEEDEPSCPDYSWKAHADGRLELVVGGELADVYISRNDVFSKAMVDARTATAVTA